jgi:hypothetical protein
MARKDRPKPGNPRAGAIVIREKKALTAKITLQGPTSEDQGRNLAAALNAVIATYNTKWFLNPDGSKVEPRIVAQTGRVS